MSLILIFRGVPRYARGFSKSRQQFKVLSSDTQTEEESFHQLLENSRLLTSGGISPIGQKVLGEIIAVVENDLYIDFGGKFHGVVKRPERNGERFVKGVKVDVILKDLEVTHHFLGEPKDSSLLEADIELVGLANAPKATPTLTPNDATQFPKRSEIKLDNSLLQELTKVRSTPTQAPPTTAPNEEYEYF